MKFILSETQTKRLVEALTADVIKGVGSIIYTDNDDDLDNAKIHMIDVDKIDRNQTNKQSKEEKDYNTNVNDISKKLDKNKKFTPIIVYKNKDRYVVLDGHHRLDAYKKLNKNKIEAIVIPRKNIKYHKELTKKMEKEIDKIENPS